MNKNRKSGFVVTAELILLATILVLGLLVGMAELRDSLVAELDDLGDAYGSMDQSYSFNGVRNQNDPAEETFGSSFQDDNDPGGEPSPGNPTGGDRTYGGDTLDIRTSVAPEAEAAGVN